MIANIQYIHLADDEWGNELMEQVAREWFDSHPDTHIVHVYEHAGWYLAYIRDDPGQPQQHLTVVDTANDGARLCERADNFLRQVSRFNHVGSHRRESKKEAALA